MSITFGCKLTILETIYGQLINKITKQIRSSGVIPFLWGFKMVEYKIRRKILWIGAHNTGSFVIALPKIWAKAHNLVVGEEIDVAYGDYDFLKVLPIKKT